MTARERGELPPTVGPSGEGSPAAAGGDLVGSVLAGRYRILRLLGEGAMGSVYLGEHLKIGRQDAIKVLRDALSTDAEAIARFVRGTRNVSMIRHPNICTIYDYSDTDAGLQFVAMELVSGETLRDLLLREGVLPVERAIPIAKQVADALQAAHDAGIVHRDLKPANIMVSRGRRGEDVIKVVDFDIAKGPRDGEGGGEEVTRLGFVVGTPEYMSPEQLIGDRLDGRSDLYSLALVLFRMLTGVLPFRAEGAQDIIVKRLTEAPMRLSEALPGLPFPEALDRAIQRALSRKPEDRQADAEEFGEEIVRAVGGAQVLAPAPAAADYSLPQTGVQRPAAAPAAPRGRRTALLAGGGVAAAAVVALAAVLATRGGPEPAPLTPIVLDQPLVEPGTVAEVGPATPTAEPGAAEREAAREQPPAPTPGRAETPATSAPTPAPSRAEPEPEAAPPATAAAGPTLDNAAADALLSRLFDRVGPPYPDRAALALIRDSAEQVAEWRQASPRQQARAAVTIARTHLGLGEREPAVRWLERALASDPTYRAASTLLAELR